MNPLPLILAELRRNPWGCAAIVALIAMAVALGAAFTALERALWLSTVHAMPAGARMEMEPVLGYVHDFAPAVPFAFDGLLVTAVLLIVVAYLSARRQEIGALRTLGAPTSFLVVAVWLQVTLLIAAGVLIGLVSAYPLTTALGAIASAEVGFAIDATIGVPEWTLAGLFLCIGSLLAASPSLLLVRQRATHLLRSA